MWKAGSKGAVRVCVHECYEFRGTFTSSRPESVCGGRELRGLAHVDPPTEEDSTVDVDAG